MEQRNYRNLQGLLKSDFQIVSGEPNIIGWKVKSESNADIGEVKDLLFDPQTNAVRYLIVDLRGNGMNLNDKNVMIPIGIAHLHTSDDEVILPNVHIDQFNALPDYKENEIGPETEMCIRNVIGSPAALRMEEAVAEFDQNQFYTHHHFDKDKFYQRNTAATTIHDLVENSKAHNLHAADEETGKDTHHNEQHQIKPWLQPGADHNQGGQH